MQLGNLWYNGGGAMFQSSPVPEDGCNLQMVVGIHGANRFNPHPSRRTGATTLASASNNPSTVCVSILTRPGGRVQHLRQFHPVRGEGSFNPHPSRRTGATISYPDWIAFLDVSILTRPGGRVQHGRGRMDYGRRLVSILTRPGGRVQQGDAEGEVRQ